MMTWSNKKLVWPVCRSVYKCKRRGRNNPSFLPPCEDLGEGLLHLAWRCCNPPSSSFYELHLLLSSSFVLCLSRSRRRFKCHFLTLFSLPFCRYDGGGGFWKREPKWREDSECTYPEWMRTRVENAELEQIYLFNKKTKRPRRRSTKLRRRKTIGNYPSGLRVSR